MNKVDMINAMATSAGITKKDAEAALAGLVNGIKDSLKNDDRATLIGFGTFSVAERKERNGINPQTQKKIKIPAKSFAYLPTRQAKK